MIRGPEQEFQRRDFPLMPPRLTFTIAVLLCFAAGCAGRHVNWHAPGTIEQQRLRATIHDPYAAPDIAPEVDGGRPRDYIEPLPQPVRNRIYVDSFLGR